MRRFFFLMTTLCIVSPLYAQDLEDYISLYDYGAGLDWMSAVTPTLNYVENGEGDAEATIGDRRESVIALGPWFGWNFPIVELDNNLSAGISPNITMFTVIPSLSTEESEYSYFGRTAFGYTVPLMATLKYGTDAQYKGKMKFGLTFGVGYRYTSYIVKSNESMESAFGVPIIMGELNFKIGRKQGLMKIRYLTSLGKGRDKHDLELSQSSIFLVYTPNW